MVTPIYLDKYFEAISPFHIQKGKEVAGRLDVQAYVNSLSFLQGFKCQVILVFPDNRIRFSGF